MQLPKRDYFTLEDLAIRWHVAESDIQHLVETGELAVADKYAAIRGKRYTLFKAKEPILTHNEKTFCTAIQENLIAQPPLDDDVEIILVDMPDHLVPYWDDVMLKAKNKYPETSIVVFLLKDVQLIEAKHHRLEDEKEKYGRREQQLHAIKELITEYEFNPLEIPNGGKAKIKAACDKIPGGLFTKDGFIRAWQKGLDKGLFKMKNHDKFTKS